MEEKKGVLVLMSTYNGEKYLREQLDSILTSTGVEVTILVRDDGSTDSTVDILKEYNKSSKIVMHCFSGSVEFMKECVKEGWYVALGGVVTFKNAVKMKDVAKEVPLDRLLLETDAPYLTPVPFRGSTNQPAYVKYVAEEIAKLREISFEEVDEVTTQNAKDVFFTKN